MTSTKNLTSSDLILRFAKPDDCNTLFDLIKALAEYEKLSHAVTGNADELREHLFGEKQYIEAIVAEYSHQVIGFALFFHNYSTFLTKPGIYLEDLFVLAEYRGKGIGKALLTKVGEVATERNCGRFEWSVLDWNEPAKQFYRRMGASILKEWEICRVTEKQLKEMNDQ
ncbi:MAG: GNAT family N-acetyltransferase [Cyanobacteria bacterium P01_A01_bin.84]